MSTPVVIVDSGTGNLRSVARALAAAGGEPVVTGDPEVVRRAERVVFPGQGAFRDCLAGLAARGLDVAVREHLAADRPYLGICLGLQVLFEESDEHGVTAGLGLLPGRVTRLTPADPALKVPHMGWNAVSVLRPEPLWRGLPDGAHAYYVHGYHAVPTDRSLVVLESEYGGPICAAVRRGALFACQFHPEKSGGVGLALLRNFLEGA